MNHIILPNNSVSSESDKLCCTGSVKKVSRIILAITLTTATLLFKFLSHIPLLPCRKLATRGYRCFLHICYSHSKCEKSYTFRPGNESIQVDLRIPSRVESILLTSTTGFVDLSRFCFKSTQKRLTVSFSLLSSILSIKQQEIINERRAICYVNSKLQKLNLIIASLILHALGLMSV